MEMSIDHPGEGGRRFFQFAVDLRSAGMALGQIERQLEREADFGRSANERRAQIKGIMDTLRKSWRHVN